ncbi:type II toxin-antitoxin system HicA family toxin [Bradyrhizobium sp.]|uniref:type II toxin-antitoxin system HicA family toxin n=1 Tax=Bradyrhizobium sp. TaxID=376 RepID=UPI002C05341B|nr:type II toxin-antitoxin system HicA family toxin [Bradyrhizobium sp.]HWX58835.1 type II toxin-antitoxin system HicA family toxin [Bradyrhizobium sp.]
MSGCWNCLHEIAIRSRVRRIIERRGWVLLRVSGSRHTYRKTGRVVRLSIPIHGNKPLKIGLLRHLGKLAEILEEDL